MTVAIGLGLLFLACRTFFRPTFEKKLLAFEDQGWFRAASYKRSQGQRVRRGTMLGVLLLVGSGIYTLLNHGALSTGDPDWKLGIPFAQAQILVRAPGDTGLAKDAFVDRNELREANDRLADHVRIDDAGGSEFRPKQIVSRKDLEAQQEKMKDEGKEDLPKAGTPMRATAGETRYLASVTLLPDVKFTVPLLLAVGALWLAWRLVNFPVFADFLIATEAELNKVSWTTRKRLVQDTIVVLVTVILFTVFLLCVDIVWGKLLASRWIGVLRYDPNPTEDVQNEVPW
jgi:preprotein translocase SecE subunit